MTTETLGSDAEARANLFPQYLMKLLNDEVAPTALWWLPDGQAFALDPKRIDGQVLDKYFQKTKYSSFIRRLHNEGYRRQTRRYKKVDGLDLPEGTVVLSHALFQRERPELLENFYVKKTPIAVSNSGSSAAPPKALQEAKEAAILGLFQARLRPSMADAHSASSMFGPPSLTPLSSGAMGLTNCSSSDSLSKSILALRQARRERELASDETLRMLLWQQGALNKKAQSWSQLGGRASSSESSTLPRSFSPDSFSAAASNALDTQLQLQQLRYENSRRQVLEEQGKRLSAVEALRRAAFAQHWR
jgi:HSF-type DNA-binding